MTSIHKPNLLYKTHENLDCEKLLSVSRYLYYLGYDIRPYQVWEANFPMYITQLPTLVLCNNVKLEGLKQIVYYYENLFNINDLLEKALKFISMNPRYRITDKASHKRITL